MLLIDNQTLCCCKPELLWIAGSLLFLMWSIVLFNNSNLNFCHLRETLTWTDLLLYVNLLDHVWGVLWFLGLFAMLGLCDVFMIFF